MFNGEFSQLNPKISSANGGGADLLHPNRLKNYTSEFSILFWCTILPAPRQLFALMSSSPKKKRKACNILNFDNSHNLNEYDQVISVSKVKNARKNIIRRTFPKVGLIVFWNWNTLRTELLFWKWTFSLANTRTSWSKMEWMKQVGRNFRKECLEKLPESWQKCIDRDGDYVEH